MYRERERERARERAPRLTFGDYCTAVYKEKSFSKWSKIHTRAGTKLKDIEAVRRKMLWKLLEENSRELFIFTFLKPWGTLYLFIFVCISMDVYAMAHVWRSQDNLWELAISFHNSPFCQPLKRYKKSRAREMAHCEVSQSPYIRWHGSMYL